jgi:two-component system response regulator DesR
MVAEENQLFLDALVDMLNQVPEFEVVGPVCDPNALVAEACRIDPTVVVLGMGRAGLHGLKLARELRATKPSARIVLIATGPSRAMVERAIESGAGGVVPTTARLTDLVRAIRNVLTGCVSLDPRLFASANPGDRTLSEREREILRLTAQGTPTKEIAEALFLSPGTVRNLTSGLIKKLNGRNRFDAARIARERGWL